MRMPATGTMVLAAVCGLAAALGAFLAAGTQAPLYESRAELSDPLSLLQGEQLRGTDFSLEVVIARTAAAEDLPDAVVRRRVTVSEPDPNGHRTITALAPSPRDARDLAARYTVSYIDHRTQAVSAQARNVRSALRTQLKRKRSRRARQRTRQQIRLVRAAERAAPPARFLRRAPLPAAPVSPKPWRNALLALVAGALLGVVFRRLAEHHARRPGDARPIAEAGGRP